MTPMSATSIRTSSALDVRGATQSYTGSVTYMKQLTVVAMSCITHLKCNFAEENYATEQFGGLRVQVLKAECKDVVAQFLITALVRAFDALDKQYLHQIAVCFYEGSEGGGEQAEHLLEYHLFEYEYTAERGAALSLRGSGVGPAAARLTADDVQRSTERLLRACIVMSADSEQLPDGYDVSVQLFYNDAAPERYQAPGFSVSTGGAVHALIARGEGAVRLGAVRAALHRLTLRKFQRNLINEHTTPDTQTSSPSPPPAAEAPVDTEQSSQELLERASEGEGEGEGELRCECGLKDYEPPLLTCSYCGSRQHAACFGRLEGEEGEGGEGGPHCCVRCHEAAPAHRPFADVRLLGSSNRKCYAAFRRALAWLWAGGEREGREGGEVSVSERELRRRFRLTSRSARKLLIVLHNHGMLAAAPPLREMTRVGVVRSQLEAVMSEYFHTVPGGGARGGDRRGEVEGEVEVEVEVVEGEGEGATLREYRAALAAEHEADELPLSGSHNPVEGIEQLGRKRVPPAAPPAVPAATPRRSGTRANRIKRN